MEKFFCIASLSILGSINLLAGNMDIGDKTHTLLVSMTISNEPVRDAISKLASIALPHGIIINFEQLRNSHASDRRITTNIKTASITNAVSELIKIDSQYSWEKNGRIINIYGVEDKRDSKNILNQIIPSLQFQNKNKYEIIESVFETANRITEGRYRIKIDGEVVEQIQVWRISYKEFGIPDPVLKKHSFKFSALSVREILNAISEAESMQWEIIPVKDREGISVLAFPFEGQRNLNL